jgi:hypothetical protein
MAQILYLEVLLLPAVGEAVLTQALLLKPAVQAAVQQGTTQAQPQLVLRALQAKAIPAVAAQTAVPVVVVDLVP